MDAALHTAAVRTVAGAAAEGPDADEALIGPDGLVAGETPQTDELLGDDWIPLSDPDFSELEQTLVQTALGGSRLSAGPMVERFERAFADWLGRRHAVAVASGTLGTWLALRALGIGPGDEVICSPHGWHQVAQAITLAGATPVFSEIHYWTGCLDAARAEARITPRTRALLAGNVNGHPAAWDALRALAERHGLRLIEDSTEAIGSRYRGRPVGRFGDLAVFDFSQPSALCCGEGAMVVTDDDRLAIELRYLRQRSIKDRNAVAVGARVPLQAAMGELGAALGVAQLARIDGLLERRQSVERSYRQHTNSFEGIKPPYIGEGVDVVHWMVWVVHLGTRFTASARKQIVEDLAAEHIEAAPYCKPLHQQFFYQQQGWQRGDLPLAERIGDRALALPFHAHLDDDEVKFIVATLQDTATNIGAGAAIY
ncbi:DegT/DnrJ/EryC1/StrS family aminotransferase [Ideonella sp. 4Y11]|uniref:DegT/DnrJ/EryC1/StrS family aminotransferase n=1 Tax=Ideonella aquatica TaxID=2824119 RepID=A0A940YM66_9BURK|nr:DegT/DnrJ/EryC1/StrS family aminotransferase [Ideonella aquatica]MBQ0961157.1 DegT/DnrJ/EryC1/StrS family aminotransferase [Ideonella aquatica]